MNYRLIFKRIALLLLMLLVVTGAGFVIWASNPLGPMAEAEIALQSDDQVTVTLDPWLVFEPMGETAVSTAFIFYPGGRVDYRSYAPAARAIAEEGYLVIIPPMPLSLAVFDSNAADDIIAAYDEIEKWAIGGHSLGGAMASSYVYNHEDELDGLVLWAAYPAESNDLSSRDLSVLDIYGTEDGSAAELPEVGERLLPDAEWLVIDGGNHAQFGYYGVQSGDGIATISREEQHEIFTQATAAFLESLESAE